MQRLRNRKTGVVVRVDDTTAAQLGTREWEPADTPAPAVPEDPGTSEVTDPTASEDPGTSEVPTVAVDGEQQDATQPQQADADPSKVADSDAKDEARVAQLQRRSSRAEK